MGILEDRKLLEESMEAVHVGLHDTYDLVGYVPGLIIVALGDFYPQG